MSKYQCKLQIKYELDYKLNPGTPLYNKYDRLACLSRVNKFQYTTGMRDGGMLDCVGPLMLVVLVVKFVLKIIYFT